LARNRLVGHAERATGRIGYSELKRGEKKGGTRGAGDIKERKLNSLISGLKFPDKRVIIPCSIQGKNLALAEEVAQIQAFTAANGRNEPIEFTKFPVFFPVSREFKGGEGFARDCILRQQVSTAEKLCYVVPEISEKGRLFAVFPQQTGPEKMAAALRRSRSRGFSPEPPLVIRFQEPAWGECLAITNRT
jgi:hypothetical protein